jgi:ABC-type Fe3+-hydroxamate transport system substrate-binding protein
VHILEVRGFRCRTLRFSGVCALAGLLAGCGRVDPPRQAGSSSDQVVCLTQRCVEIVESLRPDLSVVRLSLTPRLTEELVQLHEANPGVYIRLLSNPNVVTKKVFENEADLNIEIPAVIEHVAIEPTGVEIADLPTTIRRFGVELERSSEADALATGVEARWTELRQKAQLRKLKAVYVDPSPPGDGIWISTGSVLSNYDFLYPDILAPIELLEPGKSPRMSPKQLAEVEVDLIFVPDGMSETPGLLASLQALKLKNARIVPLPTEPGKFSLTEEKLLYEVISAALDRR